MEELMKLLTETCPGIDFAGSEALIDDEILDSLDIVTIVSAIMDTYGVTISVDDLIPENFNSVAAMLALIQRLQA